MSIVRRCGQEVNGAWMWMYDATKATEKLSTEHSSTLYTRKSRDHSSLVLDVALLLLLVDGRKILPRSLSLQSQESYSWNNIRHHFFSFLFILLRFFYDSRYSRIFLFLDITGWSTSLFKLIQIQYILKIFLRLEREGERIFENGREQDTAVVFDDQIFLEHG